MTARKPAAEAQDAVNRAPRVSPAQTYVAGSHAARVRAEHDARRTELLARDEILAAEIETREAERHDINEALRLMSHPGDVENVVPLRGAAE